MSHLVSPSFANFPGGGAVVWCWFVGVFGLFVFCVGCWFLASRGISASNSFSFLLKIPVVDRPCLVLARQCREKKRTTTLLFSHNVSQAPRS